MKVGNLHLLWNNFVGKKL